MFDVSRELGSSVALYSRKVLIQTKATDILPKWLRFVRGTVVTPRLTVTPCPKCHDHVFSCRPLYSLLCVPNHPYLAGLSMGQAGEELRASGSSLAG